MFCLFSLVPTKAHGTVPDIFAGPGGRRYDSFSDFPCLILASAFYSCFPFTAAAWNQMTLQIINEADNRDLAQVHVEQDY